MHNKTRSARFKAIEGDGFAPGTFSAVVAVYGNVDSVGDRIVEGAFDATLKSWQASGDPIPIVLAHDWSNPFAHIGYAMPDKVKSVPGVGLVVEEGHLDLDNPTAKQVHKLMERRTLKEFSFGYGVPAGGQAKAKDGAMDLKSLDLIEFGPCLKGVNDSTELLSVKATLEGQPSFEERLAKVEELLAAKSLVLEDPQSEVEELENTEEESGEVEEPTAEELLAQAEKDLLEENLDIDIDSQLATLAITNQLRALETDPVIRQVLESADDDDQYLRQLDEIEDSL